MKFDLVHKGYGIRIRKGERLYALIFQPRHTRPLNDIPSADIEEGEDVLFERAREVIERNLNPQG